MMVTHIIQQEKVPSQGPNKKIFRNFENPIKNIYYSATVK